MKKLLVLMFAIVVAAGCSGPAPVDPASHGKVGSGLFGPIDIPFGVPSLPAPGITRVGTDNSGNVIQSIGGSAYANLAITTAQTTKLAATEAFARCADLTDSNQTINPYTDHCSLYVLQNGVISTNRTLTLANSGGFGPFVVNVVVLDTSASTYTIQNSTPSTLYTHAANSQPLAYGSFSSAGGVFATNTVQYAAAAQ
jgi:hypothetical protein